MTQHVRARYRERALEPDTLFLLNAIDAIEFLNEAHNAGLTLAGIDGFSLTDAGAYQPRQDFSNDFADFDGSRDRFLEETRILMRRGEKIGIRFQIVLEEAE